MSTPTPPTPAAPAAPAAGSPAPPAPAPAPPAPAPPAPAANGDRALGPEGEAALAEERRLRKDLEAQIARLQQQGMSDAERAIAAARDEGRAEANAAAARLLAAAEFRHLATGRITDPDAAIEMFDLDKLVKDGAPNKRAIAALVDRLAAVVPAAPPAPGHMPAGPRAPAAETDWLGAQVRAARG